MNPSNLSLSEILAENDCRVAAAAPASYDPLTGLGCEGPRSRVVITQHRFDYAPDGVLYLPDSLIDDPGFSRAASVNDFEMLRCRHDFEFWAARCALIQHKTTGRPVPFILNAPQRRLLSIFESMRRADRPIRVILLKARQWGGSTIVQMYMAWIQCALRRDWNSVLCSHLKNTSGVIRGSLTRMLRNYPVDLWDGDEPPALKPYEGCSEIRRLAGRGNCVTVCSAWSPDAIRGQNIALAHLSETAFWPSSPTMQPADLIRSVVGSIVDAPLTMVVLESTANGMGNFFHNEWLRAREHLSNMTAVFVPWHEIEIYRSTVADPQALVNAMDSYEWSLWERGLSLEQIQWYHDKRRDFDCHQRMMAEFPSDDTEAFFATSRSVFRPEDIERLRRSCIEKSPTLGNVVGRALTGPDAIRDVCFNPDPDGSVQVWAPPASDAESPRDRYVAVVDIGGRSEGSDWSVVTVLDRGGFPVPEIAAQWRGHCDHDRLAWLAAAIATWYNNALLVIESNSLESSPNEFSTFILEELSFAYPNLYSRIVRDRLAETQEMRLGFHTNRQTKAAAIATLIAAIRDGLYTERCPLACNELAAYEQRQNGAFAAPDGEHDDLVMTRAIALYVAASLPPLHPSSLSTFRMPGPLW